jgi:hypothetical protein
MLLHVPILGRWLERRWMPDPVERDAHREVVRARLEAPTAAETRAAPSGTEQTPEP